MLYPKIAVEEWIKKYPALSVIKRKCFHCKNRLTTTIPFVEKHWAGLQSEDCTCGKGKAISISTIRPNSEFSGLLDSWFKHF
jgi:hypothetical protein